MRAARDRNVRALRLKYRVAYNAFQTASARLSDDKASTVRWDVAFKNLEAARIEILAVIEENAPTAARVKPVSHAASKPRLTLYQGTCRSLAHMKREVVEWFLGRKITDEEWLKARSLLEAIDGHPDAETVMESCIERGLSVDATISELCKLPPTSN